MLFCNFLFHIGCFLPATLSICTHNVYVTTTAPAWSNSLVFVILWVLNLLKTISILAVFSNNFYLGTFLRAGNLSFLPLSISSVISITMANFFHLDCQPTFLIPFQAKHFSHILLHDQANPQHFLPLLL